MLYVGLDLSRKRLGWHAVLADGELVGADACPPDGDGLAHLVCRLDREQRPVLAAIESMTGARFVHDQLEQAGWEVRIADAQRAKGIAPLACLQDRSDRRLGLGRARPPRPGAGDLAARPGGAG